MLTKKISKIFEDFSSFANLFNNVKLCIFYTPFQP